MHDEHDVLFLRVEEGEQGVVTDGGGVGGEGGREGVGRVEGRILDAAGGVAGFAQHVEEGLVGAALQPGAWHEEDGGLFGAGHVPSLRGEDGACEGGSVIFCSDCSKATGQDTWNANA